MSETDLSKKMRSLKPRFPSFAAAIDKAADDFDAANNAEPFDAKRVLGAWARARKLYCDLTGESLI